MASSASKVFSLSLAKGILLLVQLVSGMVFTRALSLADYGTYLQTFLAYDIAVPILTFGLPSALYYFLPEKSQRKKGLVLDNITLLLISGLLFSSFLYFGGTELLTRRFNNPELAGSLQWMVFYPIYTFPLLIGSAVWVTQDKVKLNATYNVVTGIILTTGLILAAIYTKGYQVPTMVRIVLPIAFLPFGLYFIFKHVPGSWSYPSVASMWKMLKFSIPLGIASMLGTLTIQASGVIVSALTSREQFAIFASGAKEVPFIGIITGSIAIVIMADMTKYIKLGKLDTALALFRKGSVLSACFLLPIMVFLFLFAESFIWILYSDKYIESVSPFRIYLFMLPIRIVYYASAFIALGKTKAILFRSIFELAITCCLAYFLTKSIGYIGAAIGTVSMYYIWAVPYNLKFLSKEFNCKPSFIIPFDKVGKIMLLSLIAGVVASLSFIIGDNHFLRFLTGGSIFVTVYSYLVYKYIPDLRELIHPLISKLKFLK